MAAGNVSRVTVVGGGSVFFSGATARGALLAFEVFAEDCFLLVVDFEAAPITNGFPAKKHVTIRTNSSHFVFSISVTSSLNLSLLEKCAELSQMLHGKFNQCSQKHINADWLLFERKRSSYRRNRANPGVGEFFSDSDQFSTWWPLGCWRASERAKKLRHAAVTTCRKFFARPNSTGTVL